MSPLVRRKARLVRRIAAAEALAPANLHTIVVLVEDATNLPRSGLPQPRDRRVLTVAVPGRDLTQLHHELARLHESTVAVIDARASLGPLQVHAFEEGFFHLGVDDVWMALRSPKVPPDRKERLVGLARRFEARKPGRLPVKWQEHRRAIGRVEITSELVLIEKNRAHLLKVRDEGSTALLNDREPDLEVSEGMTLPSGTLSRSSPMTDYGPAPAAFPRELPYPAARTRVYEGEIWLPTASVAVHGRSVLPDSFRWHLAEHPFNGGVRDVNDRFARRRHKPRGRCLEGAYYFFYYNHPGHFGHLMTEAIAKLWGWHAAKAANPELKLLCREHPKKPDSASKRLENVLLPAFGIDPADIEWVSESVRVEHLVGVTPLWHNAPPYYVHPALTDDWGRLREGLPPVTASTPEKVFVARPPGNRHCRNAEQVEDLFARHGFAVVRPEFLPIAEQAALFSRARIIAGFGGSGMFNLVYADAAEKLVVLNQSAYWGRSEHLFASALDIESHFFWSDPVTRHAHGSYQAHQAAWSFDVALHEDALADVLSG